MIGPEDNATAAGRPRGFGRGGARLGEGVRGDVLERERRGARRGAFDEERAGEVEVLREEASADEIFSVERKRACRPSVPRVRGVDGGVVEGGAVRGAAEVRTRDVGLLEGAERGDADGEDEELVRGGLDGTRVGVGGGGGALRDRGVDGGEDRGGVGESVRDAGVGEE